MKVFSQVVRTKHQVTNHVPLKAKRPVRLTHDGARVRVLSRVARWISPRRAIRCVHVVARARDDELPSRPAHRKRGVPRRHRPHLSQERGGGEIRHQERQAGHGVPRALRRQSRGDAQLDVARFGRRHSRTRAPAPRLLRVRAPDPRARRCPLTSGTFSPPPCPRTQPYPPRPLFPPHLAAPPETWARNSSARA